MATQACIDSTGKTILGKDCQSQEVVKRLQNVDALICDMIKRQKSLEYDMSLYCPNEGGVVDPAPPVVVVEPFCLPVCEPYIPLVSYLISVNELTGDVYEALTLLEEEACAANTSLKLLEQRDMECVEVPE